MNTEANKKTSNNRRWQAEIDTLKKIIQSCSLTEEIKWGKPCFTIGDKNIVLIQGFKEYCALLFFKGALLNDKKGILVKAGENTQAARQIRFTDAREIIKMKSILKGYIKQAIDVEKAGLKVELKKSTDFTLPGEFKSKLDELPALKKAFYALTPGRQRAYLLYFSAPKQSITRESRIEKYLKHILNGKGIND